MAKPKSKKSQPVLRIDDLNDGLPAITAEFGASLAQAAAVCLESQNHSSGVELRLTGRRTFVLQWTPATEQMRRCWNEAVEATEFGACGIAFLLILKLTEFTIIERSRKGTGFDYWLGRDDQLFQKKARLEISGILKGDKSAFSVRLRGNHSHGGQQ
jgi:hypothetical protein